VIFGRWHVIWQQIWEEAGYVNNTDGALIGFNLPDSGGID